ncbi:MAG: Pyrrolo-quinoline quinone [Verrucomicrobiales bacterium]|nr:Pyrrolo-quinoline quinone [Verrucomicrobiales bacterium]
MVPVKIECGCGQRYAFDVEPVNGRMPSSITCPSCGADGTAAANEAITYMLSLRPSAPKAMVASPPVGFPLAAAAPAAPPRSFAPAAQLAAAPIATASPAPSSYAPQATATAVNTATDSKGWKWWYYILAGILIGIIDGWYIYETGRLRYIKGLLLAVLLIAIGVWDFTSKRKTK